MPASVNTASPHSGVDAVCVTDGTLRSADTDPWLHNVHGSASSVKRGSYNLNWSTTLRLFTSTSVVSSSGKVGIAVQGSSEAMVTFGTTEEPTAPQEAPSVMLISYLLPWDVRWMMI